MNMRLRFPELDLLRFFAACSVMLFHFTFRGPADGCWPASFPVFGQISRYGYLGVHVFFILSGFVILLTAYEKNAVGFTVARIIRLYPAYWICVTLTALALLVAGNQQHISLQQYFANLTMAHGYFGIRDVSGVYWTLAVELKFYFLIFLVLLFRMVHRLSYLLGAWLTASIILSLKEPHGIANFFLFPEWSSYFIAGAMLFLIHREGLSAFKLAVVLACYGLSICYAAGLLPVGVGTVESGTSVLVLVSLITLFYLVFLWIALRKRSPVSASGFFTLGLITYPLYLLHQDIGYVLLRSAPELNRYGLVCAVIVTVIALSWLVTIGPERWLASRLKTLIRRIEEGRFPARSPLEPSALAGASGLLVPAPIPIRPSAPVAPPSPVELSVEKPLP
jgi:peptidoglycan/LPS O-acetylase OafA/YrhL